MSEPNTLVVDLAVPLGPVTGRASGLLLGITGATDPAMLSPLRIKRWRANPGTAWMTNPATAALIKSQNIEPEVLLSSGKWRTSGVYPGDGGDWAPWEAEVTQIVTDILSMYPGLAVSYDIWNEPDYATFFPRPKERFFELYRRAYPIIRALHPAAKIVAPSITAFKLPWLSAFLTFAQNNAMLPDRLTWHDLRTVVGDIGGSIKQLKTWALANGLPPIELNEIGGLAVTTLPSIFPVYFAVAERQRISMGKASWGDTPPYSHHDLGQLLTADGLPTAVWWVYKAYADLAGTLYKTVRSNAGLDGVAALDGGKLTILAGAGGPTTPLPPLTLSLKNLPASFGASVRVSLSKIKDSGYGPSSGPYLFGEQTVPVVGGTASATFVPAWRKEAFVIEVEPA